MTVEEARNVLYEVYTGKRKAWQEEAEEATGIAVQVMDYVLRTQQELNEMCGKEAAE